MIPIHTVLNAIASTRELRITPPLIFELRGGVFGTLRLVPPFLPPEISKDRLKDEGVWQLGNALQIANLVHLHSVNRYHPIFVKNFVWFGVESVYGIDAIPESVKLFRCTETPARNGTRDTMVRSRDSVQHAGIQGSVYPKLTETDPCGTTRAPKLRRVHVELTGSQAKANGIFHFFFALV